MFFNIDLFKNFSMFAKKAVSESLSNKAGGLKACIFIKKEILTQVFSCEYSEMFVKHFLFIILIEFSGRLWVQN